MKLLALIVVAMVAAVGLGLLLMQDPGYVLIGYREWTVETSLMVLLIAIGLLFAAAYISLRLLAGVRSAPARMRGWDQRRRALKARDSLSRGLLELAEGKWQSAERRLLKHVAVSESPLLNYLAAARAAQQQGEHDRRDHYLKLAHQAVPGADIAVGLTQAELQISHRQMEQALATLTHLRSISPNHGSVLKMLMKLYERLQDWERLRELLPQLRKRKVITGEQADQLERRLHCELVEQAAHDKDLEHLRATWGRVPKRLQSDEDLVYQYASQLLDLGGGEQAEGLLRDTLRRTWSDRLVDLYGRAPGADPARQMAVAEEWLKERQTNPVLLQALARLALRNRLWGKARSLLESSIGIAPNVESYQMLGGLLEQLEEPEAAIDCYRKGTMLAAGASEMLAAPAPEAEPEEEEESSAVPR